MAQVPPELSAGAEYGFIVLNGAPVEARRLARFTLSPEGQKILADYGFVADCAPSETPRAARKEGAGRRAAS